MIKKIAIISDAASAVEGWYTSLILNQALSATGIQLIHICELDDQLKQTAEINPITTLSDDCIIHLIESGIKQPQLLNKKNASICLANQLIGWSKSSEPGKQTHNGLHAADVTTDSQVYFSDTPFGLTYQGVEFHHYLGKYFQNINSDFNATLALESFSVSAYAAQQGKLVLPQANQKSVLSEVRFSANIKTEVLISLLKQKVMTQACEYQAASKVEFATTPELESKMLADDKPVPADFFIDCRGKKIAEPVADLIHYRSIEYNVNLNKQAINQAVNKGDYWYQVKQIANTRVTDYFVKSGFDPHFEAGDAQKMIPFNEYVIELPWQKNKLKVGRAAAQFNSIIALDLDLLNRQLLLWLSHFPKGQTLDYLAPAYNQQAKQLTQRAKSFAGIAFYLSGFTNHIDNEIKYAISLFKQTGYLPGYESELKPVAYWISLLLCLGVWPQTIDPLADNLSEQQLTQLIEKVQTSIKTAVANQPNYDHVWG